MTGRFVEEHKKETAGRRVNAKTRRRGGEGIRSAEVYSGGLSS
jgi:hypothetical protein